MNSNSSLWLGYSRLGGRFAVKPDEMGKGIAMLGHGSNDLAPLVALACEEAGMRALIIDIGGVVSSRLSGYIDEYAPAYFLYDSLRMEENAPVHAQLAASAYACTLDLSFEQEATLNSVMQIVANEKGIASPIAIADLIQSPDTAKARTIDKVRLRLEALRSLNVVGDIDVVRAILEKSAILNFRGTGSPEAAETAAALFIVKLIALMDEGEAPAPDVIILTEANRLFKARPVFRKSQRFLTSFVSLPSPKILASEIPYGLDEDFLDTCPIKILSSAAWNESSKGLLLTPNMFMFQNHPFGYSEAFIPRSFEPRKGERKGSVPVDASEDADLATRVMQEIGTYQSVTRSSLIAFLSSEFPREALERVFDRLQNEGLVTSAPQAAKSGSGRTMHMLSLTDKGRSTLRTQPG
ncbi:MAG TPA: hypothetical protein VLY65_00200 [Nitrososphaerales archaeon]|nr:hypothetical protein [Nitrososphaerales archaeon]